MAQFIKDLASKDFVTTFRRTNPTPVDNTSVFKTYDELSSYALSNAVAYVGQNITFVDETNGVSSFLITKIKPTISAWIDEDGNAIKDDNDKQISSFPYGHDNLEKILTNLDFDKLSSVIDETKLSKQQDFASNSWNGDLLNTKVSDLYATINSIVIKIRHNEPSLPKNIILKDTDNSISVIFPTIINLDDDTTLWIPSTISGKPVTLEHNYIANSHHPEANWSKVTTIILPTQTSVIGDYTFDECNSLTSISIPSSVLSVNYGAFYGCNSVKYITLPHGLKSIGIGAFAYCNVLEQLNIPNSLTSIGALAFKDCPTTCNVTTTFTHNALSDIVDVSNNTKQFPWGIKDGTKFYCSDGIMIPKTDGSKEFIPY